MPGSLRSSRITSGASSAASASAVAPSPASPTTSIPSCTSSSTRSPRRTTGWSSTISTEIGASWSMTGRPARDRQLLTGTVIRTTVPGRPERMVSAPPAAAARSRIEASPRPPDGASGANPWPSSATSRTTWRGGLGQGDPDAGRPGVPQRVVQRLLGHPVERRLLPGARARAGRAAVNVTGTPCARPPAPRTGAATRPARPRPGPAGPGRRSPRAARRGPRRRARRPSRSRPGPGRVDRVPGRQHRGGPGVHPDAEQLLRDRVVQLPGQPGPLLAAPRAPGSARTAGRWSARSPRARRTGRAGLLVALGEAAAGRGGGGLVGREDDAEHLVPPSRTGMPRKCGHVRVRGRPALEPGSSRMSASRSGLPSCSSTPSMPCWRGSGPIACRSARLMPSTTNSANESPSSGTPSAAYRASTSERADRTIISSTSRTDSCLATATARPGSPAVARSSSRCCGATRSCTLPHATRARARRHRPAVLGPWAQAGRAARPMRGGRGAA